MLISKKTIAVLALTLLLGFCAKATNVAKAAVAILDNYPDLLGSLNLPIDLHNAVLVDFKDLTRGATVMSDAFATISKDDPEARAKHLTAVNTFSTSADAVFARGHFDAHPALSKVKTALKGLLVAAKIYYSPIFGVSAEAAEQKREQQEADLEAKLNELKAAMKPK